MSVASPKESVRQFWEAASCGESLYLKGSALEDFLEQANARYELEPFIWDFARFPEYKGKKVLEIGVGLGADHQRFAEAGAELTGVDLTERSISHTRRRLRTLGLESDLRVGDAEHLSFSDGAFDLVYSWGVLHHSPDTAGAVAEVHRVLKPGGEARIMIYHKFSFVGYMLWLRYGLLKFKPRSSLREIYANHLESPGTKAYSVSEAAELFRQFKNVRLQTVLTHGDLLTSSAGQRHSGRLLALARKIWPRRMIKAFFPRHGLFMLIHAIK